MKKLQGKILLLSELFGLDLPYFIGGGFWLIATMAITSLGGVFIATLFARYWPKDMYGQYTFLLAIFGFMSATALPGMKQVITQAVAEGKDGVYPKAIRIVLFSSLLGVMLLVVCSIFFYFTKNSSLTLAFIVIAIAFPLSSVGSLYVAFYHGKKAFKKASILNATAQFVSILTTATALFYFPSLLVVTLVSVGSVTVLNFLFTVLSIKETVDRNGNGRMIKFGIHLSISQLLPLTVDYLDKLLVPLLLGFTNNAVYSFALLVPQQINNLFKITLSLGQPKIAQIADDQLRHHLLRKMLLLEIVIILIVLFYWLVAPLMFHLLFPAYRDSTLLLSQVLSLGLLFYPANLFGLVLIKKLADSEIYKTNLTYAIISILSFIIFIPSFGLWGAIIAKIITRIAQAATQLYFSHLIMKKMEKIHLKML